MRFKLRFNFSNYRIFRQEDGTLKAEIVFGTEEAARTACLLSNALIQDQPIFVYQKEESKVQHPGDPLKKLADDQELTTEAKGTATAVINNLLAAGYKIGEEIKKKALEYDGKLQIIYQRLIQFHAISL